MIDTTQKSHKDLLKNICAGLPPLRFKFCWVHNDPHNRAVLELGATDGGPSSPHTDEYRSSGHCATRASVTLRGPGAFWHNRAEPSVPSHHFSAGAPGLQHLSLPVSLQRLSGVAAMPAGRSQEDRQKSGPRAHPPQLQRSSAAWVRIGGRRWPGCALGWIWSCFSCGLTVIFGFTWGVGKLKKIGRDNRDAQALD